MDWLTNPSLITAGVLLALYQVIAALPWLRAIDPKGFSQTVRNPTSLSYAVLSVIGIGLMFAVYLGYTGQSANITLYGKVYGSILHLQLLIDFFILAPHAVILISPKAGAVAQAARRARGRKSIALTPALSLKGEGDFLAFSESMEARSPCRVGTVWPPRRLSCHPAMRARPQ